MQKVTDLRREHDGLSVTLSDFGRVRARAVLLATGASYRRLGIPALEALNGAGVFYGGAASAAPAMAGRDVYVLGGANSADRLRCTSPVTRGGSRSWYVLSHSALGCRITWFAR